jgi:hypothetical protein
MNNKYACLQLRVKLKSKRKGHVFLYFPFKGWLVYSMWTFGL